MDCMYWYIAGAILLLNTKSKWLSSGSSKGHRQLVLNMLVLTFMAVIGTAPTYRQALVRPYAPTRALRSAGTAFTKNSQTSLFQVPTLHGSGSAVVE